MPWALPRALSSLYKGRGSYFQRRYLAGGRLREALVNVVTLGDKSIKEAELFKRRRLCMPVNVAV